MPRRDKTLDRILRGTSDANIAFDELCALLRRLGFQERSRGSHHIFERPDVNPPINLQPAGKHAKPYQVRQVRNALRQIQNEEGNDAQI